MRRTTWAGPGHLPDPNREVTEQLRQVKGTLYEIRDALHDVRDLLRQEFVTFREDPEFTPIDESIPVSSLPQTTEWTEEDEFRYGWIDPYGDT